MKDSRKHHIKQFGANNVAEKQLGLFLWKGTKKYVKQNGPWCFERDNSGRSVTSSVRKRQMKQTNLWRYFRRKYKAEDQNGSCKDHHMEELQISQSDSFSSSIGHGSPTPDVPPALLAALHSLQLK